MGIKVPEDLAVIAFTDGIISKYSTPTITTVSQNGAEMGSVAAKILIERLESEEDETQDEEQDEIIQNCRNRNSFNRKRIDTIKK